jgi:protocatechuate 3,4-dioxygenase beta subunit
MAHVTRESITEAVIKSFDRGANERFKCLIAQLVNHLHQFARETSLTHDEWRAGLDFLTRAGGFTDAHRNEFVLTSDVLGLSSLVDLLTSSPGATEGSVLGPFHTESSPLVPVGTNLIKDNAGDPVLLRGRVLDCEGNPVAGAMLDFWQTAANGLYPAQDADQDPDNLRCRMRTGIDGKYEMKVIRPSAYTVPYDGPVGDLLRAGGRHAWRPAHFHFIVSAPRFRTVVTELFTEDDPYIAQDAAFGVRDGIVVPFKRNDAADDAVSLGLRSPFFIVEFDFRLRNDSGRDNHE